MNWPYKCTSCGYITEIEAKTVKYTPEVLSCFKCAQVARPEFLQLNINLGGGVSEYAKKRFPYYDESVDQTFTSLEQKNKYLKDNGLRIKEKGEGFKKAPDPLEAPFDEKKKEKIIRKVNEMNPKRRSKWLH